MGIGVAHRQIGEALCELGKYEEALQHQHKYLGIHFPQNFVLLFIFVRFYSILLHTTS